jgi:thermitase
MSKPTSRVIRAVGTCALLASSSLFAPAVAVPAAAQTVAVPVPTQELYPRQSTPVMLTTGQPAYPIKTVITSAGREAVADRLLVHFQQPVTAADLTTIQSKASALGAGAAHALIAVGPATYLVDVSGAASLEAAAQAYKLADPRVADVGADSLLTPDDAAPPNDPQFPNQKNISKVQLPAAWNRTHGQAGKWIAILDTGIDSSNADLANQVVANVNMFSANETTADVIGHGTHVAGIAGAITNNGLEVAGASFSSQLLNVKVFDDGSVKAPTDAVIRGIYWAADHGASVINMSLGAQHDCDTNILGEIFGTDNARMRDALDYAWSKNIFVAASAGNDTSSDVEFPASCPHVMGVANVTDTDTLFTTSNFGSWVSLAAPGVNVLSTAHPGGVKCQSGLSGGMSRCTGTSMAAPLVSGTAALVQASCGTLPAQAVWDHIANTADPIAGTGTLFQNGRLNALKAVCFPIPTNLHIGTVGMNSLQLLWNDTTPGESFFEIQSEISGTNSWTTAALVAPNTVNWTHSGLTAGTSYDHRVRACDSNGCSSFSNVATASAGFMRLTVSVSGAGTVTSAPAGIKCGTTFTACSMLVAPGTVVHLTPTASGNLGKDILNVFDHWEGACAAAGFTCSLTMNSNLTTKAVFVKDTL